MGKTWKGERSSVLLFFLTSLQYEVTVMQHSKRAGKHASAVQLKQLIWCTVLDEVCHSFGLRIWRTEKDLLFET